MRLLAGFGSHESGPSCITVQLQHLAFATSSSVQIYSCLQGLILP